jgi:hypothetical protein
MYVLKRRVGRNFVFSMPKRQLSYVGAHFSADLKNRLRKCPQDSNLGLVSACERGVDDLIE